MFEEVVFDDERMDVGGGYWVRGPVQFICRAFPHQNEAVPILDSGGIVVDLAGFGNFSLVVCCTEDLVCEVVILINRCKVAFLERSGSAISVATCQVQGPAPPKSLTPPR